ncbi:phosphate ABC transporter substrate-binding protein PstS [Kytococcus schroeteri]|uniref:phosphate ABC transporter substrate-binding protein PstS n=1 Tax=Kytococcus schroeteri TaxID=138300 RepID=UPI0011441AD1|nr:phosphate ABC transporter substrate-binding protein PstS [Kytococcus schroeteri]
MKLNRFGSVVALATASSLTLAACGGDSEDDKSSETTTETSTDASAPAESGDTESPAESGDTESPAESGDTESPDESGDTESPDESSETSAPEDGAGAYPTYTKTDGAKGDLKGVGSSAQESAVKAWIAGYQGKNGDVTVNYSPDGSGAGVEQFLGGATPWAGSDVALDDEEMQKAKEQCGDAGAINLPAYISPVAIAFNIEGVDSLNLSPETMAKIFNGEIETWNDDAIKADNPDVELPETEITVVARSDESGTTANFQEYLKEAAGDAWPHEPGKEWPADGEKAKGTSGVVSTIQGTDGAIGYADASQVGELKSAKVKVGEEFVEYSPEAAAKVVEGSKPVEGREKGDLALKLDREVEGGYPIVLVTYEIACKEYKNAEDAAKVKDFLSYVITEEAQQKSHDEAGSAPISAKTAAQIAESVKGIKAAG